MKRWLRVLGIVLMVTMLLASVVVAECRDSWILPGSIESVQVGAYEPGTAGTYFDVLLANVGNGFSISDGEWPGWCADSRVKIGPAPYANPSPRIYSSLDPELGTGCSWCADDEQWDKINYLLNHKDPTANWGEIQVAIWYLADAVLPPLVPDRWAGIVRSAVVDAMVADANANGAGFCPAPGQTAAVIVVVDDQVQKTQLLFVELRQPAEGVGTPGFWKNHPDAWPANWITLGGTTYDKQQALGLFNEPEKADKSLTMFRALAAAELNKIAGNDTSCVDDVMAAAHQWMAQYPAGSKVKADSAAWKLGEALYNTLDAYNNGRLCAPSRD